MIVKLAFSGVLALFLLFGACASFETVSTGYEAVGARFGKVTGEVLSPGFHVVNPLNHWDHFNTLQRTAFFEKVAVPAADQQRATMDISVQFRIVPGATLDLRKSTGTEEQVIAVHFTPNVRGVLRDAGRSTQRVEDFYNDTKIEEYKTEALAVLQATLATHGIEVTDVIVRDVRLPDVIERAIEAKKQREQEVEKERAELNRVELEAQQQVKQAQANLEAERHNAQAVKVKAEAEAYAIDRVKRELTSQYVDYIKAQRWDGSLPRFTGGGVVPFINLNEDK